jgi:predicted transcriptional regulator
MLMGQEKQRISERLERLAVEREKLSTQLNELEIAERVLARFDRKAGASGKLERTRPANTAPAVGKKQRAQNKRQMPAISLSDAILKAVQAHDEGATASEVLNYLSKEFGIAVRPNHLGMALQRHRRAGRLDNRGQRWHLARSA